MNRILLALLLSTIAIGGCVKKDFETPPDESGYDPMLPVTHSIDALKKMNGNYDFKSGGDTTLIQYDVTIAGIVTADDRSGNLYKSINIEDSTGGIQIAIEAFSLYNDYPVGRKVYVKCRGLVLGYNGGTPVLGSRPDERFQMIGLSGSQIGKSIVKGPIGNTVTPKVVTMAEATSAGSLTLVNRLVTITDVQFLDSLGNLGYAQANGTTNREIRDCGGKRLSVRTSQYSDFFMAKLPTGNGSITGIFTIYMSPFNGSISPQLQIRDTSDVRMAALRCGGGTGGGGGGTTIFSETFTSPTTGVVAISGWTNYAETGTEKWEHSSAGSSNPYARVSAFGSGQASVVSWLVTPAINLAGAANPVLTFKSANGFDNGATLKAFASSNFSGDVLTATWVPLSVTLGPSSASGFGSFTPSGNVSLSAFSGNVWIAWKYEGSDASTGMKKTTTWEVDDVKVTKD